MVVSLVQLSPLLCVGLQYVVVSLMILSHLCGVWWSHLYGYLPCVVVSIVLLSPLICGSLPCVVVSLVWWSPSAVVSLVWWSIL